MDWATAAAYLSEQAPNLSDPPDDPREDDDLAFWLTVRALVESGGELEEAVRPPKAGAQSIWKELLHPRGRHGQWIRKMDSIAQRAHEGQTDKQGAPYINHVRAVADSVSPEARGVAYFHDALEDTEMTPDHLKEVLDPEEIEAVKLLTRPEAAKTESYEHYIQRLADAPGRPGELAREVKRADLQHNLGRLGGLDQKTQDRLRPRYQGALDKLASRPEALPRRGEVYNRAALDPVEVEGRMREMYDAAVASGHAEEDARWYQDAHDLVWQQAARLRMDPYALTAMVAATSPKNRWVWPEGTPAAGTMPNLRAALKAVAIARKYPGDPAPVVTARPKPGMMRDPLDKSLRLYRGEDPNRILNASKTRSFYNNIAFPDRATTTTIDALMARSALGQTTRADYDEPGEIVIGDEGGKSGYAWMADRVEGLRRALADEGIHLMPHELQAIIWSEQQRRQDANVAAEKARRTAAAAKAQATKARRK